MQAKGTVERTPNAQISIATRPNTKLMIAMSRMKQSFGRDLQSSLENMKACFHLELIIANAPRVGYRDYGT
jgi:hypothetical protein